MFYGIGMFLLDPMNLQSQIIRCLKNFMHKTPWLRKKNIRTHMHFNRDSKIKTTKAITKCTYSQRKYRGHASDWGGVLQIWWGVHIRAQKQTGGQGPWDFKI
jgi:hypothetical protein